MPRSALIYCTLSLLLFATLSWLAASAGSATVDEPIHAAGAITAIQASDYRIDFDHPPLWKFYAALPQLLFRPPVHIDTHSPPFTGVLSDLDQAWQWSIPTLYQTPGNDPDHILAPMRFMMLLISIALGAVIALFSYKAAGPAAALTSCLLYSLDPNFLAHASLMKNDIAITFCITLLTYLLYRSRDSLTLPRLLAISLCTAASLTTKLTGLLALPLLASILLLRALSPTPWLIFHRPLTTRLHRTLAALIITLFCCIITYTSIWAVYRFRFSVSPDPNVHFHLASYLSRTAGLQTMTRYNTLTPTPAQLHSWTPTPPLRAILFSLHHHLLPEPFLQGLLVAYSESNFRPAYLLGHIYHGGNLFYFPLAFLVKTPSATLAAAAIACTLFIKRPRFSCLSLCLLLPILLFGTLALSSSLNIGLRHIFPLYPSLFIAIGITASHSLRKWPRPARLTLTSLALLLSLESLSSFPHYIPFFNTLAGGPCNGIHLLSDSNIDWGQDLPELAAWQDSHPDRPLYLAYFGSADPSYYGIRYHNLPAGYPWGPPEEPLPTTGHLTIALSAPILQGVWNPSISQKLYPPFLQKPPTQILGSLYLYNLDQ